MHSEEDVLSLVISQFGPCTLEGIDLVGETDEAE